jgi:hypothetical protein
VETTLIIVGDPEDGIFEILLGSTTSGITIGTVTCEKASYKDPTNSGVWDIDNGPWCWVIRNTSGVVVGAYGNRAEAVDNLTEYHDNESCYRR